MAKESQALCQLRELKAPKWNFTTLSHGSAVSIFDALGGGPLTGTTAWDNRNSFGGTMPGLAVQIYATYPSMPGALRALCPDFRGVTPGIRPWTTCVSLGDARRRARYEKENSIAESKDWVLMPLLQYYRA